MNAVDDVQPAITARRSRHAGALVANDLALGRRARSFGVRWLRTADLVVHAARTKPLTRGRAAQVIDAMESAGRMGSELAAEYRQEIVDG